MVVNFQAYSKDQILMILEERLKVRLLSKLGYRFVFVKMFTHLVEEKM